MPGLKRNFPEPEKTWNASNDALAASGSGGGVWPYDIIPNKACCFPFGATLALCQLNLRT
jgi:hypothetical protein